MFNIGSGELLVIFLIALLVLGPKQLPQAARQLGRALKVLSRFSNAFRRELQKMSDDAIEADARERGKSATAENAEGTGDTSSPDVKSPASKQVQTTETEDTQTSGES